MFTINFITSIVFISHITETFEYSLAIEVHVSTFSRRKEVKLPIFIGTKKLEEST